MNINTLPFLDCRPSSQPNFLPYAVEAASEGSVDWNAIFEDGSATPSGLESPIMDGSHESKRPAHQLNDLIVACIREMLAKGALKQFSSARRALEAVTTPVGESETKSSRLATTMGISQIGEIVPPMITSYEWKGEIPVYWLQCDISPPDLDDPLALGAWLRAFTNLELQQVLLSPVEVLDPAKSDSKQVTLFEAIVLQRYESVLETIRELLPRYTDLKWIPATVRHNILSELSEKIEHELAAKAIFCCLNRWDSRFSMKDQSAGNTKASQRGWGIVTMHPKWVKLFRKAMSLPKPYSQ